MEWSLFSVGPTVEDPETPPRFHERPGLAVSGGGRAQNYLIVRDGSTGIGLLHDVCGRGPE